MSAPSIHHRISFSSSTHPPHPPPLLSAVRLPGPWPACCRVAVQVSSSGGRRPWGCTSSTTPPGPQTCVSFLSLLFPPFLGPCVLLFARALIWKSSGRQQLLLLEQHKEVWVGQQKASFLLDRDSNVCQRGTHEVFLAMM